MKPRRRSSFIVSVALVSFLPAVAAAGGASISGKVTGKHKRDVKDTVVYVVKASGTFTPPSAPVTMNQQNQKFDPFVLPVLQGTTVKFLNDDNTKHNVFSPDNETYDLGTWGKGESRTHVFSKQGTYTQLCRLHPSMLAYVVVLQNPYFTVTKDDGSFTIENVPAGSYELTVWNKRYKATPKKVKVGARGASGVTIELKH